MNKIGEMIILVSILAGTIALIPLALYLVRRVQSGRMRRRVAAEGFETATDILFPHKRRRFRKYRIGPVLPQ